MTEYGVRPKNGKILGKTGGDFKKILPDDSLE